MSTYEADRRREMDRRYRKQRLLRVYRGLPTGLIPVAEVAEHVDRLVNLGWSCVAIQQMAGERVSDTTVVNLLNRRHDTIERKTAAVILAVPHSLAVSPKVDDTAFVPALGAQRRIHALLRSGWPHSEMRRRSGVDTTHTSRGTYTQILARKWRAVDDLWRELAMMPGPSPTTAKRAAAAGYPPALAWDNIDDPDERPNFGIDDTPRHAGRPVLRDEHIENAQWMADADENLTAVCKRLGLEPETFYQACRRAGRTDLYALLSSREPTGEMATTLRKTKQAAA